MKKLDYKVKNEDYKVNDLVERLRKRAEIRRQIPDRKSVQNNEPDRIADLLEEAADSIEHLEKVKELHRDAHRMCVELSRQELKKASETCNGFCGEYECKENQANCKRINK